MDKEYKATTEERLDKVLEALTEKAEATSKRLLKKGMFQ